MPKPIATRPRYLTNPNPVAVKVGRTYWFHDAELSAVLSGVATSIDDHRAFAWITTDASHTLVAKSRLFLSSQTCAAALAASKEFTIDPATTVRRRGRPRATVDRPQRTLGRVAEADWQTLQEAARIAGQTFTEFALSTLLAKARRVINDANNWRP